MALDSLSPAKEGPLPKKPNGEPLPGTNRPKEEATIIDIRRHSEQNSLADDVIRGLNPVEGQPKTLPTLLLYDDTGLKLFERITYLDEYYLTNTEIGLLEKHSKQLAARIPPDSVLVELGSGNLRKTSILLRALEAVGKKVDYYALDVSLDELKRTLAELPKGTFNHVRCQGLHGTYDDGFAWLSTSEVRQKPKTIMSLGSSIGNFERTDAAGWVASIAATLKNEDIFMAGIDHCKASEKVFPAYNDKEGLTHRFILNGLEHANRLLGGKYFNIPDWHVVGEYNELNGCHQAFVVCDNDVVTEAFKITAGEKIRIERSYKYDEGDVKKLWDDAGVVARGKWCNETFDYGLHVVQKPNVYFSQHPEKYAASNVPTVRDWERLWTAWDTVTLQMIPNEELLSQPIKLRNACIFYLGHIPTFLDIHICRGAMIPPTEPAHFRQIFERGIDPDVDDPERCHAHSEIPDSWPDIDDILIYQRDVRSRLKELYSSGLHPRLYEAVCLAFEHEIMHLETLLYMLVQSDKTLAPPGVVQPDFEEEARQADVLAAKGSWLEVPGGALSIGRDAGVDPSTHLFGWDNEFPKKIASAKPFLAKSRPITNAEYAEYLQATGVLKMPASWTTVPARAGNTDEDVGRANLAPTNSKKHGVDYVNGKYVKTVFGPVPLKFALHWPVSASYDELAAFARWAGGRIPTQEEVNSIYEHVERLKEQNFENALGRTIPAVNGHLSNNGVQETPPSEWSNGSGLAAQKGGRNQDLFVDLEGCNVGFQNWTPRAVDDGRRSGRADFGGLWEWTSSILKKERGFAAMESYPGYTADFFDDKHNIVLGGSWATHPRIAGRRTFINWYQRNYPYVWAGARLVRDL